MEGDVIRWQISLVLTLQVRVDLTVILIIKCQGEIAEVLVEDQDVDFFAGF